MRCLCCAAVPNVDKTYKSSSQDWGISFFGVAACYCRFYHPFIDVSHFGGYHRFFFVWCRGKSIYQLGVEYNEREQTRLIHVEKWEWAVDRAGMYGKRFGVIKTSNGELMDLDRSKRFFEIGARFVLFRIGVIFCTWSIILGFILSKNTTNVRWVHLSVFVTKWTEMPKFQIFFSLNAEYSLHVAGAKGLVLLAIKSVRHAVARYNFLLCLKLQISTLCSVCLPSFLTPTRTSGSNVGRN